MTFASVELARRIEAADADVVIAAAAVATRHAPDAFSRSIGGGVAGYAGANAPFNKVVGLGFEPLDETELTELEQQYARFACPVQIELPTLADPAVSRMLISRGYELMGYENILAFDLTQAVAPASTFDMRTDPPLEEWIDLIVDGFASPELQGVASHEEFPRDALVRAITDMVLCEGFTRFTAMIDGAPAGAASVRIGGELAQLTGAATLPDFRRRGVQSALLAHRLSLAARAGATLALITTLPGSKSQQNAQSRGFDLLYARAMFVKSG